MKCVAFHALASEVELCGPAAWVDPIAFAYQHFKSNASTNATKICWDESQDVCVIDSREVPKLKHWDEAAQFYNHFLTTLLDGVIDHAVLHGAAGVHPSGKAFIIAAPSGCGKSSLLSGLLDRGMRVLSDDFAPLNFSQKTVAPWPRKFALDPQGAAPLPDALRIEFEKHHHPTWMGKHLIDPCSVWGDTAWHPTAASLSHVFLLTGNGNPHAHSTFEFVASKKIRSSYIGAAARLPTLEWIRDTVKEDTWIGSISHPDDSDITEFLDRLAQDPLTVFSQRQWSIRPNFNAAPKISRLPTHQAALRLAREWMNRRKASKFLQQFNGNTVEAFFHLTAALSTVRCMEIEVGRYEATLDLILRELES